MILGYRLRELRKENRMSQEDLGKLLGVTKVSISGYENGTRVPSLDVLQGILDVFGVSADFLLGRELNVVCEDDSAVRMALSTSDIEIINLELVMADLETVEKRIQRVEKKALTTKDKDSVLEYEALKLMKSALEEGKPARSVALSEAQEALVKSFNLLTKKPTIFVANVGEEHIADPEENPYYAKLKEFAKQEGSEIVHICAKVEEEISLLEQEDREMFLESYGIKESGLERVTKAAFKLLGLETYFTAGPKESKAWTFKTGMKAPQCAGIIHSDFERGFIKAEVYTYDDIIEFKSELKVKENGKLRIEGKEYIVKDGDIIHIDVDNNLLELEISDEELAERRERAEVMSDERKALYK